MEAPKYAIGEIVTFVVKRPNYVVKDNQKMLDGYNIYEGEGIVRSIHVDHTKRLIVQVADETEVYNADLLAINPTPEFVEKFRILCENIVGFSEEAKIAQSAIVKEYNDRINELYDELLGKPMEMDYVKKETQH